MFVSLSNGSECGIVLKNETGMVSDDKIEGTKEIRRNESIRQEVVEAMGFRSS